MTGSGFGQPVAWNVDTYVSSGTENSKFTIAVAFLYLSLFYSNRFLLSFLENYHAPEPLVLIFCSNNIFPYLSAKFAKLFP